MRRLKAALAEDVVVARGFGRGQAYCLCVMRLMKELSLLLSLKTLMYEIVIVERADVKYGGSRYSIRGNTVQHLICLQANSYRHSGSRKWAHVETIS